MRESIGKTVKTSVTEMLKTYKKSRLMGIDINLRFALYQIVIMKQLLRYILMYIKLQHFGLYDYPKLFDCSVSSSD